MPKSYKNKGIHKVPRISRVCESCNLTFQVLASRLVVSPARFCSKPCLRKWQIGKVSGKISAAASDTKNCKVCGNLYMRGTKKPITWERGCCSQKCFGAIAKHSDLHKMAVKAAAQFRAIQKARDSGKAKQNRLDLKKLVFESYGGAFCNCCGETHDAFLALDHIHENSKEFAEVNNAPRRGYGLYGWLKRNGFPSGFQVLCYNCNNAKHKNGGICPHQTESRALFLIERKQA